MKNWANREEQRMGGEKQGDGQFGGEQVKTRRLRKYIRSANNGL